MAQNGDAQDLMGYEALAQEALRGVVKAALKRAAGPGGLPGAHHFYVSFKTRAPGVSIPPDLVEKFPDEMTIVLQNQFWDLAPGETFFSVTLRFGGQPKRLSMPYGAVTRFYDPSVQFLLQFEPSDAIQGSSGPTGELVSLSAHRDAPDAAASERTAPERPAMERFMRSQLTRTPVPRRAAKRRAVTRILGTRIPGTRILGTRILGARLPPPRGTAPNPRRSRTAQRSSRWTSSVRNSRPGGLRTGCQLPAGDVASELRPRGRGSTWIRMRSRSPGCRSTSSRETCASSWKA